MAAGFKRVHGLRIARRLATAKKQAYLYPMTQFAITQAAAAQIGKILATENAGAKLRVAVQGGGCSGFSYIFSIEDTQTDADLIFTRDGVDVLVDDMSLQYMDGAEIDWVDDLIGASFRINNPNATASCGCGTSFDI